MITVNIFHGTKNYNLLLAGLLFFASTLKAQSINENAIMSDNFPKMLSEYNFFKDPIAQIPTNKVIPYQLMTELFSDYTKKKRFLYVPNNKKAVFEEDSVYQFPLGTALIKTFYYNDDERKANPVPNLLETRVLLKRKSGWKAASYVWDMEKKDAELKIAGKTIYTSWINSDGDEKSVRYRVPNVNQCQECHESNKKVIPIGPKARNLNFNIYYSDIEKELNQLRYWFQMGLIDYPSVIDKSAVDWTDHNQSLDRRARSYLDINCGHCHSESGNAASSGLYLNLKETRDRHIGVYKKPVAAGRGSGGKLYSIVPAKPEDSILLFRMKSKDPGIMMPESGRALNHDEGINLIHDWINNMGH